MPFRKYDHVERLGHPEVQDILLGDVWIFPKLDGTNASVWFEVDWVEVDYHGPGGLTIGCGSRTRTLSADSDNAGFWQWAHENTVLHKFMQLPRNWHLYGEWLVPHTLKTYRDVAWRRFWVFDVWDRDKDCYLSFEQYEPTLRAAGLDVVEPLCTYTNPTEEQLQREVEANTYLIQDGAGPGEGVVVKNYAWRNGFGRQPWAKIVRNEFKEENKRAFGTTAKIGEFQVEAAIAEEYVTPTLVQKTRAKIEQGLMNTQDTPLLEFDEDYAQRRRAVLEQHRGQIIPRLLETVFYELVNEELWMALKQHKFPTIDFKKLRGHSVLWTKKYAADLF